jgi:hypothetical protein
LTFEPHRLVGHFVQLTAQPADKLGGLGGIAFVHGGSVARLALSPKWTRAAHNPLTKRNYLVTVPVDRVRGGLINYSDADLGDLVPCSVDGLQVAHGAGA